MNLMSEDLSEFSPYEYHWDEYDSTPSLILEDRCEYCHHLVDETIIGISF
jgi:hypothetical protein